MEDIRYSELVFLQKLATSAKEFEYFQGHPKQAEMVELTPSMFADMALTLLEDGLVRFEEQHRDLAVSRLRGELSPDFPMPTIFAPFQWANPRKLVEHLLTGPTLSKLAITYRGLRRIEELREQLRKDRILERFGILLDFRYVQNDLRDALHRDASIPISVLYADLDNFKPVNDRHGHDAGDLVLTEYLKVVRDTIGSLGTAYRGTGDEVVAIIVGQGHERAVALAEQIRVSVSKLECKHNQHTLPAVTTSIGVATTPPQARAPEIESVAEARNRAAKIAGRNRVISESVNS